jgi:hypothetical protein
MLLKFLNTYEVLFILLFVNVFVFESEEGVFRYLLGNCCVSYAILVSTVLCLKYSVGPFEIFVFTVLRIGPYHYFHGTLRAFHEELIYLCCEIVAD